ncbi:alpha/beta-hydrolase [Trematosphaeria pertusa]|uniref:Alpha/beta-hydrolase n=1 Tax=Trematosphaeria pertusa TaxID=390896 RepID=A0A6A6IP03_9PLEO|nr:alpha/beta-hydrolase [Trematosphaeria pertusa]KAF2251979.1 alpha/beta-hydrolase [Trematosphaeria pertusa]
MELFLLLCFLSSIILHLCAGELSNFDDWDHQRIKLDDVSIHLRYHGSGPPILLVHGFPQHSLTWHTIGPILAQNYTVIAPDIRGMGDSSLSSTANYTAAAAGADLKGILDFLRINQTYIFAHDKGVGLATSLAIEHPEVVSRFILAEYALPGYGYPTEVTSPDLYQNWQLSFFGVPDAAEFFISGREKQMLSWYFFHASYSGTAAVSVDHLQRYTNEISKPGFLRAGLSYFGTAWDDERYFQGAFEGGNRLTMPMLALGGEASFAPASLLNESWGGVSSNFVAEVIPKAGHWIGDENPTWTANRALRFFGNGDRIPSVDLTYLSDKVTLVDQ